MESMIGKFRLANQPKSTRRKRKNLNLTPGASTSGPQRGGNSPTTEPTSHSANTAPSAPSFTSQSSTAPSGGSGVQRSTKRIHQPRKLKRGGNHYNWILSNDPLSSPTTDETLPVTPQSDMSSTFSVSPSPSFGRPQSPIYERRGAVSAGPHNPNFGFFSGTELHGFTPTSAPLNPAPTWPMSTAEESQRFPEPTFGGLFQTRSDGALDPHNQAFLNRPMSSTGRSGYNQPGFGVPQITDPYDPNQRPDLTNHPTSNYQTIHSFDRPSSSHIDSSFLAGQAFPRQDLSPVYPSGTMAEYPVNPNHDFSLGSPIAITGFPDMTYTAYNGPYSGVNGINQAHFLSPPHTYAPPPMPDLDTESHLQCLSSGTRRASLANLAFSRTHSTQ